MKERLNATTQQVIGAAIQVQRTLGPGLLESAYETCLELECKAVERLTHVHEAQILSYLRISGLRVGLLFLRTLRVLRLL